MFRSKVSIIAWTVAIDAHVREATYSAPASIRAEGTCTSICLPPLRDTTLVSSPLSTCTNAATTFTIASAFLTTSSFSVLPEICRPLPPYLPVASAFSIPARSTAAVRFVSWMIFLIALFLSGLISARSTPALSLAPLSLYRSILSDTLIYPPIHFQKTA